LHGNCAAKHAGKDPAALALWEKIAVNDGNAGNEVALEPAI
jgi:hypothetical protein